MTHEGVFFMSYLEKKIAELSNYLPPLTKQPDFDAFWDETKRLSGAEPLNPKSVLLDNPLPGADTYDISYAGFDGTEIHGWYIVPHAKRGEKLPCLIHYHGFGGNRGKPWDFACWLLAGVAVLSVDCREQNGATGNTARYSGGFTGNLSCKGIQSKHEYYFRAVYMDCVRAIDFALTREETDKDKIILEGGSQGGALAMAVTCLDNRPYFVMADVPSNSDLITRVIGGHGSFAAVREYLKSYPERLEDALTGLSYFDTMNMADKISCPVFASVGLMDETCPARCFYATYNRIPSPKEITVYPFNGHDGGHGIQTGKKLEYLAKKI
jgi:cephalosporin-C deacetylase